MNKNQHRTCTRCGAEMRLRMNRNDGRHFYSCIDQSCSYTESAGASNVGDVSIGESEQKEPPKTDDGPAYVRMLRDAELIQARAEKDIPDLIDLDYDKLTPEQRAEKARYWMAQLPKTVFRPLPYDKEKRGGAHD